jgi:deazaflavin-dependent oxidoreductase (nitroreductase family)
VVHGVQRRVVNPIGRRLPITMLETIGRKSGQPRRTAVGGRVVDGQFWMVSEHGDHSHYVLNIKANPAVRLRIRGRWRTGTATTTIRRSGCDSSAASTASRCARRAPSC